MHARVITAQLQHDKLGEVSRLYQQTLMPTLGARPGFQGALLLVDGDTGKSLTIMLWETEADLRASERDGLYQQLAGASQLLASTPMREVFEVSAQISSHPTIHRDPTSPNSIKEIPMSNLTTLIQNEFIGAWNARDPERVLAMFTDDAVVTIDPPFPGAPGAFKGKAELPGFVNGFISGIHVETRNYRVAGDKVLFEATVGADATRMLGVDGVEQTVEATVRDGKVAAFTINISPEAHARLVAGAAKLAAQA
jgi:ketosteroid isomerase-like protein